MHCRAPLFFLSCWIIICIQSTDTFIIPTLLDASNKLTWHDAEQYCMNEYRTNLVSIHSYSEYESVVKLASERFTQSNFWIGLNVNMSLSSSSFVWSDETAFDFGNVFINSNDSDFEELQNEKCVTITWEIVDCDDKYWPICNSKIIETPLSIQHKKRSLAQTVLNDVWLLLGVALFAGFIAVGIIYCFIILVCVCCLNIQTAIKGIRKMKIPTNDRNMNMNFDDAIIVGKDGKILSGVKHKFKYKQRTVNIPKLNSPYSRSIQTSLNVRAPNSKRTPQTEDVSLMTGIIKDIIIPVVDVDHDTSTEYYQNITDGRLTIGDIQHRHQCLTSEEIAIKENTFSIDLNLQIMQSMHYEEEDTYVTTESDTMIVINLLSP